MIQGCCCECFWVFISYLFSYIGQFASSRYLIMFACNSESASASQHIFKVFMGATDHHHHHHHTHTHTHAYTHTHTHAHAYTHVHNCGSRPYPTHTSTMTSKFTHMNTCIPSSTCHSLSARTSSTKHTLVSRYGMSPSIACHNTHFAPRPLCLLVPFTHHFIFRTAQ